MKIGQLASRLEANPAIGLGLSIAAGLLLGSGALLSRLGGLGLHPVPSGANAPTPPTAAPPAGAAVSVAGAPPAAVNATSQAPITANPWGG